MDGQIVNVRFSKVISVIDNEDGDRIIAHVSPEDDGIAPNKIPYAFPLLPKMLHIKPKKGEAVLIILAVANDATSQRYYIGPIISQDQNMYFEDFATGATAFMKGSPKKFDIAPNTNPDNNGILPNDNDVVLRGRKNADIQITDDDVRVRAGVKIVDENVKNNMKFNENDPSYIKLKYHPGGLYKQSDIESRAKNATNKLLNKDNILSQCDSTATIVADKINLIGNNSKEIAFNTKDRKDLISDKEIQRVLDEAYKLPYGEKLVDILSTLIDAFVKHTHPYPMLPPCQADGIPQLIEQKTTLLDKEGLLSDNIRIN